MTAVRAAPPVPTPRDVKFPGKIQLAVDATDVDRGIFVVRETIPVTARGPMTLLYPQWLPGNHSPSGPIDKLAGLTIRAGDSVIPWQRDPVNMFAFHVDVPAGTREIQADFQFVSPTASDQGRIVTTPVMLNVQWNTVVLYPAGYFASRIPVEARVKLPAGWKFATSLESAGALEGGAQFKAVSLDELVDSPLFAGKFFRQVDLQPGATVPVRLNVFGDDAADVDVAAPQVESFRALVRQAYALFGAGHFERYDFLLCLSGGITDIGLEHLRSSENCTKPQFFRKWGDNVGDHDLLAHELTHSWNGKFRRGADLLTPGFDVPMRDSLLWVYEGQTEYWGYVLAARSGLLSVQETLDALARTAATYEYRVGRKWRPLLDTTNDPIMAERRPNPWRTWQRSEDYYSEGQLVWLDVDTRIRELSDGKRSLDDFAKRFFGIPDTGGKPVPYTFGDIVAGLNAVQAYDWAAFLREKLEGTSSRAPLDGLARGGYRLVFSDVQSDFDRKSEAFNENVHLLFSLGLTVNKDGKFVNIVWDGPAFNAGLAVGTKLIAVNGLAYKREVLLQAVRNARSGAPIELLVSNSDRFRTVRIDYREGLRYPHLERVPATPDRLLPILAPRN